MLAAAYEAAIHLGMESELSASWLSSAAKSGSVVKRVSLRELVEDVLPAMQSKNATVLEAFRKSSAPIQMLAGILGLPLGKLYCSLPAANEAQSDARKRVSLPFFGARGRYPAMDLKGRIGLDITSILTLANLGLLDKALNSLREVCVAPDTMLLLLKEKRRIRFQQPSELALAGGILDKVRRNILTTAALDVAPPSWLVQEVGEEFARLLEKAKAEGGRVVASHPIYRAGSLAEQSAELRDFGEYVITVRTYLETLSRAGKISRTAAHKADIRLAGLDAGPIADESIQILSRPIFADAVSIRNLHHAAVLEALGKSNLQMHVPSSVQEEMEQTINEARERDGAISTIDAAHDSLRAALEQGRIQLLPEQNRSERAKSSDEDVPATFTTLAFLQLQSAIDSLVIDDRYFTRLDRVIDRKRKTCTNIFYAGPHRRTCS
ncbi:HTH domain-containing protein [Cupriavidus basilensis]